MVLGMWLIASPFVLGYATKSSSATWNAMLIGALIVVLGWLRVGDPASQAWLSWVTPILGVWLIIAPLDLGHVRHPGCHLEC